MTHPDISIIIPNFNCLSFLPGCFESIRQQQLVSYEVLVVDDGSTDGSVAYLQAECALWPELRIFEQHRQGPGAARNLAAQHAKAPLLAFLDADDWWAPAKLNKQIRFHQQNPDIGLSFTDYQHIEERTQQPVIRCFDYWPEFAKYLQFQPRQGCFETMPHAEAMLLAENVIGTSSVVVRRSAFMAVAGFDTSLPSASDWDLWLKISKIAAVGFSRDCLMYYLQRSGSVSSNFSRRFAAVETILNRYLPDISQAWPAHARSAEHAREVARHEMHSGNKKHLKACGSALAAWRLKPSTHHLKSAVKSLFSAAFSH